MLQLRSSSFNTEHIDQYALCLKLHGGILEATAFNVAEKIMVYYERFSLSKVLPTKDTLEQLITHHAFLGAGYWKEIILLEPEMPYVQVPAELFEASQATELLQLHTNLPANQITPVVVPHPSLGLVNVSAGNAELFAIFKERYPFKEIRQAHVSDAILRGLVSLPEKLDYRYLHVFVNRNALTIAFFRTGNLHLINTYQFDTPEDLLYYVLFALTELGLEKNDTELTIWGDIGASFAGRLSILQSYFPTIAFGTRPKGIQYHYQFDELDNHAAFDLISAYYLCTD